MPNFPEALPQEIVVQLNDKEPVILATSLVLDGQPIVIECFLIKRPHRHDFIVMTAVAGGTAVGFIDMEYVDKDGIKRGHGESPHTVSTGLFELPHSSIRLGADRDGFYVSEEMRGKGVGSTLFRAMTQVLRGLGATGSLAAHPSWEARPIYEKWGGIPVISGYGYFFDFTGTAYEENVS